MTDLLGREMMTPAPPGAAAAAYTLADRRATYVERGASVVLLALGMAIVVVAVAVDYVGDAASGARGFGAGQIVLAVTGLWIATWGADLWRPQGVMELRAWRGDPRRILTAIREARVGAFLTVVAMVALVVAAMRELRIEGPGFYDKVAVLAAAGFVAHHLLPLRQRLTYFVALSILGIYALFGARDGAWLLVTSIGLIALCHLPIAFWGRVAVVVAAGGALAMMRADLLAAPWSPGVWPILGSIFMFRLICYMYDLRHRKEPMGVARTLAYFLLLPNLTFPLFPVVDFATFRKTYYDRDAIAIYQEGVLWMIRGVVHLLLYRLVYQWVAITPEQIDSVYDLARYMVANFLLYLRVSGSFHLIVGMLHLFGFRLPETHRFFFLAANFTELWRRINIYWKDFMMKVVYYPVYFRLRKVAALRGNETGIIIAATVAVFAATWFLHAYQWFWILGTFLLSWTDTAFWGILAVFLIGNTLVEMKRGRARTLGAPTWTSRTLMKRTFATAATFLTMTVLWALWTSHTFGDFAALFHSAGLAAGGRDLASAATQIALVVVGVVAAAGIFTLLFRTRVATASGLTPSTRGTPAFAGAALAGLLPLGALYAVGEPGVTSRLPLAAQEVIYQVRHGELNQRDQRLLQQGYYENLVGANRFSSQLWEVYATRPSVKVWPGFFSTDVVVHTNDFMRGELKPNFAFLYHGAPFSTNRWGMRDQDYAQTPGPNTVRAAVIGQSYVMGESVGDGETFEAVAEARLNRELTPRTGLRYELLNFAMSSQHPTIQLALMERKVLDFAPHTALVIGHPKDLADVSDHIARQVVKGNAIPYDFMSEIALRAGVVQGMTVAEAVARLKPYESELVRGTYGRMVALARERGVRPFYVYVATPEYERPPREAAELIRLAREAGFTVLDLADVYEGHDPSVLQAAPWDKHPNAYAHRLIADRLVAELARTDAFAPAAGRP